jgi:O-antigen/teichoic acid export membrane protein
VNVSSPQTPLHSARHLAGAGIILMGSQIVGMVLQVLVFSTIQHQFSQAENGTFFWIQQIAGLALLILAEMGMNSIVIRMYVEHHEDSEAQDRIITTFFWLRFGLWLLTSLILCGFVALTEPEILFSVALYALYSGIAARSALLRMVLETRRRAVNDQLLPALAGLSDIVLLGIATFILRNALTLPLVMLLFVLTALPGMIIMILAGKQWRLSWSKIDTQLARTILRETAPILVSIGMMQIQDKSDTIALNTFFGREALGAFGAIMRVVTPLVSLLMIISGVIAPPVTRLRLTNPEQCKDYVLSGLRWTILASIASALAVGICSQEILLITAGEQYLAYSSAFSVGVWTLVPGMVVAYLLAILTALGLQRQVLPMMLTLAIGAVVGNLVFTPSSGILGSLVTRIIAASAASFFGLWVLQRFVEDGTLLRLLWRSALFAATMIALHILVRRFVGSVLLWSSPFTALGLGLCVIAAFLGCALFVGLLTRADMIRVLQVFRSEQRS